jgi:hypothetical protein
MVRTDTSAGWQSAGAAAAGAFAAGCLLTQVVTVPVWRRAPTAEAALELFRRTGPATGAVLFPVDGLAAGLLIQVAVSRARRQEPGAGTALVAALSMAGTVALLPAYFARANTRLLDREHPPAAAPALLESWSRWNWLRTGLALLATGMTIASARTSRCA